jgi:hypothetical protein
MRRMAILGLGLAAAFSCCASGAARADRYVSTYRDLIRPNGHPRPEAVYRAALDDCYARTGADRNLPDNSAFKRCMRGHDYLFLSTRVSRPRAAPPAPDAPGTYSYEDVLKPHGRARSDAEEQEATRICDRGDSRLIGRPAFNACMRARGWRYAGFRPKPAVYYDPETGLPCHDVEVLGVTASRCSNF